MLSTRHQNKENGGNWGKRKKQFECWKIQFDGFTDKKWLPSRKHIRKIKTNRKGVKKNFILIFFLIKVIFLWLLTAIKICYAECVYPCGPFNRSLANWLVDGHEMKGSGEEMSSPLLPCHKEYTNLSAIQPKLCTQRINAVLPENKMVSLSPVFV